MIETNNFNWNLQDTAAVALGTESAVKLYNSTVLLIGLDTLGVEIAINLIQCGVKEVCLFDDGFINETDLQNNFASISDIGKRKDVFYRSKLQPLSKLHTVLSNLPNLDYLARFQVVVLSQARSISLVTEINEKCRNNVPPIPFILADIRGLFSQVFTDFGDEWKTNTEIFEPWEGEVTQIIKGENESTIYLENPLDNTEEVSYYTHVKLHVDSDIQEISRLSELPPLKINKINRVIGIETELIRSSIHNISGVSVSFIKPSISHQSKSFSKFIRETNCDQQLHMAMVALLMYESQYKKLPSNNDDLIQLINLSHNLCSQWEIDSLVDDELIKRVAISAHGVFGPMVHVVAGIVASEIIKATGYGTPTLCLYLRFDELFPDKEISQLIENPPAMCIDESLLEKLRKLNIMVLGTDGRMPEMIRILTKLGINGTEDKPILLASPALSSTRNLSQCLGIDNFQINEFLATLMEQNLKRMVNQSLHLKSLLLPSNRSESNLTYWMTNWLTNQNISKLDVIVTGSDFTFVKCIGLKYCEMQTVPMVTSSSLGFHNKVKTIIPYKSTLEITDGIDYTPIKGHNKFHSVKNYQDICNRSEYLIRREFNAPINDLQAFLNCQDVDDFLSKTNGNTLLRVVQPALENDGNITLKSCIYFSCRLFQDIFYYRPVIYGKQIQDQQTFYEWPKRRAHPFKLDLNDKLHIQWISSFVTLYEMYYSFYTGDNGVWEPSNYTYIKSIQKVGNNNFISNLSEDILLSIFGYFDHKVGFHVLRQVCKKWFQLVEKINEMRLNLIKKLAISILPDVNQELEDYYDSSTQFPNENNIDNKLKEYRSKFSKDKPGVHLVNLEFENVTVRRAQWLTMKLSGKMYNMPRVSPVQLLYYHKTQAHIFPSFSISAGISVYEMCKIFHNPDNCCNWTIHPKSLIYEKNKLKEPTLIDPEFGNTKFSSDWDSIEIDNPNITVAEVVEYFKEKGLTLEFLSSEVYIIYLAWRNTNMDRKVIEIQKEQFEKHNVPLPLSNYYYSLASFTELDVDIKIRIRSERN